MRSCNTLNPHTHKNKQQSEKPLNIKETKEGLILQVFVKPQSKQFKITVENNEVTVYCTQEPTKGKVNKELVKELSKTLHKHVELVAGFTSKQKTLLIKDAEKNQVEHALTGK